MRFAALRKSADELLKSLKDPEVLDLPGLQTRAATRAASNSTFGGRRLPRKQIGLQFKSLEGRRVSKPSSNAWTSSFSRIRVRYRSFFLIGNLG
jgi:hypothetical protein